MIRLYYHPSPDRAKISLFLEEAGLDYEVVPVDTSKAWQDEPEFGKIQPNGKVPAIVDIDGPGGQPLAAFDSTAVLINLAETTGRFLGQAQDRPEFLSWLLPIGSGLGPFSGQAVHFQYEVPAGRTTLSVAVAAKPCATIKSWTPIWPAGSTSLAMNTPLPISVCADGWIRCRVQETQR